MKRFRINKRFPKKESIFKKRFFWNSFFVLTLAFGLFYFFILSDVFKIKEINVVSSGDFLKSEVQKIVRNEIGKNIFLANINQINEEILGQFPEIAQLNFKKSIPHTLKIQIEKREPVAIWCYQTYDKCFFIDREGTIFKKTEKESTPKRIIILSLKEEKSLDLREKILSPQILELILEIEENLKENLKIEIEEFTIVSGKRLNAKTSEGWKIYFNLEKDVKLELAKLKVLLDKEIPPEERKNLEYIDLRFEKIFYK